MSIIELIRSITPYGLKKHVHWVRFQKENYQTHRTYGRDRSTLGSLRAVVRMNAIPTRSALFYPSYPDYKQVARKACVLNGYRIVHDPRQAYDVFHKQWDSTFGEDASTDVPDTRASINLRCNDISKTTVQQRFQEVFGYGLAVDPTVYQGPAVCKSDVNGYHDGTVVDCPITGDPKSGYVYQKLVDTEQDDGLCIDFRVPVYDGQIPIVYIKYKPPGDRFDKILRADYVAPHEVFSDLEIHQIGELARRMDADFCEMDVLRDNVDGRIYVVDVNNTPSGPQRGFDAEQKPHVAAVVAEAYRAMVESRIAR